MPASAISATVCSTRCTGWLSRPKLWNDYPPVQQGGDRGIDWLGHARI